MSKPKHKSIGAGLPGVRMIPLTRPADEEMNEEEKAYRKNLDEIEKCATAVGNLCFAWSGLEASVDTLLAVLLRLNHTKIRETITANIDPRNKIRILMGLGYILRLNDEWFKLLKWCLNQIDNDIRSRRNRFVHDVWHISAHGIKRIQRKTGFRKPQASQPIEYYTEISQPVDVEDIWALSKDIQEMILRIEILWWSVVQKDTDWLKLIEEHAPLPPQQE